MLALLRTVRRTCPALSALLASVLLLPACGGGSGGGGSDHGTAPAISNLVYSPTAVYVGAGGGTQAVHGEFSFTDPDGDVSSGTLEALDASGTVIDSQTFAISGASGVTIKVPAATISVRLNRSAAPAAVWRSPVRRSAARQTAHVAGIANRTETSRTPSCVSPAMAVPARITSATIGG